ncbi:MAG: HD domain-containing protein, partial [Firmicutes bacterium]|nr:HD domain-containing protein [Bacillota bacterium]
MKLEDSTIKSFYEKCNTPAHVIAHCKGVADAGARIASALNDAGFSLDVELVRRAGLVHDLFRVKDNHGEEAARFLREQGYTEEADAVEHHMHYTFGDPRKINETDILCLADRLVLEDKYVGLERRVDYLIHKVGETPERTARILAQKAASKKYISAVEKLLGKSIDSLFISPWDILLQKLEKALSKVEKPARYIGSEKGICLKNPENSLRFCFAFPDLYEIGMSYLGMQILYSIINRTENLYCERAFEPGADMAEIMRNDDVPLFTLETKTPLSEMDVVGFTLQYEMAFTNVIDMLSLSGITLLASDRKESEPLIIAGGPCAYNPEPLADFIDVFLI